MPSVVLHQSVPSQRNENTNTQNKASETRPAPHAADVSVNPTSLVAFITEVVTLVFSAHRSNKTGEILKSVISASSKHLGYHIKLQSLKDASESWNALNDE